MKSADWLGAFRKACLQVAYQMEVAAEIHQSETGEPESDESQRIRELLTGQGGYIFHGTGVTGLTWAYRLSGATYGLCRRSPDTHRQRWRCAINGRDGLPRSSRRQHLLDDRTSRVVVADRPPTSKVPIVGIAPTGRESG